MKSKISELAVFTAGLGGIIVILMLYLLLMIPGPDGITLTSVLYAVVPGIVILSIGALLGTVRSRWAILLAMALVNLVLLVDALLSFNLIKILISACIASLVIKTGREALQEVDGNVVKDDTHKLHLAE
jgi:ABC-type transport system involved in multi-copper enzyme maturation permease subunit